MREKGYLMSGAAARTGSYKRKDKKNGGKQEKCRGLKK